MYKIPPLKILLLFILYFAYIISQTLQLLVLIIRFIKTQDRDSSKILGSSWINQGAIFLRFFRVTFLLFLAPAGGTNQLRGNNKPLTNLT